MPYHLGMRKLRIWATWTCILIASVLWTAAGERKPITLGEQVTPKKPNIIFIMADDLGYGDLGCYGQTKIKTPNIDRLAAEGIRFTSCYAGSTVCAPSRCALMTGLHTGHGTIRGNSAMALQPSDVTLAEVLRSAGYNTCLIGKWGLGDENSTG